MTAANPSIRTAQNLSVDWSALVKPIAILNITLICLALAALAYYVVGVNAVASSQYKISSERTQISTLTQSEGLLSAEKSATEDPTAAAAYAEAQHMVQAKDIVYVFANNNVALQK